MSHLFISHATQDDYTVAQLCQVLELHKELTWIDSRLMTAGDQLSPEITQAIKEARHFVVLVSMAALKSAWVQREVKLALETRQGRTDGYKVIPIVLPGVTMEQLKALFPEEAPLSIFVEDTAIGLTEAIPLLFSAIGQQLPRDRKPGGMVEPEPVEELVLKLSDPLLQQMDEETRQARATAELIYQPADVSKRAIHSRRYSLAAPLGAEERNETRWYIEDYFRWPTGAFKLRAQKVEKALPEWGEALCKAALQNAATHEAFEAWKAAKGNKRFSIEVDFDPPENTDEEPTGQRYEAARDFLALPWEIMHDGRGYLFQGADGIRVRRRLPNQYNTRAIKAELPIRVLLLSPRPEVDDHGQPVGYFNHRVSALPMVQAMENLGKSMVQVHIMQPPTFPALKAELQAAHEGGKPYHIVHFDGHGVFDAYKGQGALCFEHPRDAKKLGKRKMQLVYADELAAELRGFGVPLVYLDACQTAKADTDPRASVAAKLLEEGVGSVVAMSHSVLVVTAQRFVEAFYQSLAKGQRVGTAMLAAQKALYDNDYRDKVMGAGELTLKDWFVPVLFQDRDDPQLFSLQLGEAAAELEQQSQAKRLGALPPPPDHKFVGRSPELLYLERLLLHEPYAVVRGAGGYGKTTLAIELVRWQLRSQRYERAVFISVEPHRVLDVKGILDSLGKQLLPQYIVNIYGDDMDKALQPIARELQAYPTLILFDNMESILPDHTGEKPLGAADVDEVLALCQKLMIASQSTRLIFTSREALPAPFAHNRNRLELGRLSQTEAIELVADVMGRNGWEPPESDDARAPQEIADLVEAVQCHPRALVQVAPYLREGLKLTTEEMARIFADLERKNPGDHENSLYASVELSLRRLPEDVREKIRPLAVVHGGADFNMMTVLMNINHDDVSNIAASMERVGLAKKLDYEYLSLDPALQSYLSLQNYAELEIWMKSWESTMNLTVNALYQSITLDIEKTVILVSLQLANMSKLIEKTGHRLLRETQKIQSDMETLFNIEKLFSIVNYANGVLQCKMVQEPIISKLTDWNHIISQHLFLKVEHLYKSNQLSEALIQGTSLLELFMHYGEDAYEDVEYDLASIILLNGRILKKSGKPEAALVYCRRAMTIFFELGEGAEHMISTAMSDTASCFFELGRLDEAILLYEKSIDLDEIINDQRGVAVNKGQLALILMQQGKYHNAIKVLKELLITFNSLKDSFSEALTLQQLGYAQYKLNNDELAEKYYTEALVIQTRVHDTSGQIGSLLKLGDIHVNRSKKHEEGLHFYEQALLICEVCGDLRNMREVLNNMALVYLDRKNELARKAVQRIIRIEESEGIRNESWRTYGLLSQIEQRLDKAEHAFKAWEKARDLYLVYRKDGGHPISENGRLTDELMFFLESNGRCATLQILRVGDWSDNINGYFADVVQGKSSNSFRDDIGLHFSDAAEILFFIERLEQLEREGKLKE